MAKYISFGESLVVDSGVQTNVAPATGTADADFIVTGTQTAATGTTITVYWRNLSNFWDISK